MANELTLSASVSYVDPDGSEFSVVIENLLKSIATKVFARNKVTVGTSEEAIPFGDIAAPFGYALLLNWDQTNYVEVRMASGASNDNICLDPASTDGVPGFAIFKFGSDVTAPYWIANTSSCRCEAIIFSR
jgi:hypothetical protein